MPDKEIALALIVRVPLNYLPLLTLTLTVCASFVVPNRGALHMALALPCAWIYLRYFERDPVNNNVRGDLRDSFNLASFFPRVIRGYLQGVARIIDACGCWPSSSNVRVISVGDLDAQVARYASGHMTAQARQHRAVATKLLNERLQKLDKEAANVSLGDIDTSITIEGNDKDGEDVE